MIRSTLLATLSVALVAIAAAPAAAQDVNLWRPTTAAGGAPVDPRFWNDQASVRFNGAGGSVANVTIAPTNSTYNDYSVDNSTPNITNNGGQTNVVATGQLTGSGGTFTVNTNRDPSTPPPSSEEPATIPATPIPGPTPVDPD